VVLSFRGYTASINLAGESFRACGLKFSAMETAHPAAPERPAEEDFNLNCLRIIRTVYPKQARTVEQDGSPDPLRCAFCRKIFNTIHRRRGKVKRKKRQNEKIT
jgi:hypothetical protein